MRLTASLLSLSMVLALAACQRDAAPAGVADDGVPADQSQEVTTPPPPLPGHSAAATLAATEGSTASGVLQFMAVDGGVHVTGQVRGLAPDRRHGFHVHETGDCSAPDASSAGGHFNPHDAAHGRVGAPPHHVGDSDNLAADAQGGAQVDNHLAGATLGDGGPTDIVGKAVIVHADADDYTTQPTGDAGDRLACGIIEDAT
ncbi:superoxide dismutase family protein [soil metagenome]